MRYAVWYIILFFSIEKNYGQNFPNIQFTHLAEKEGLSNNQVNCIAQDNDGFIWIGTNDGLTASTDTGYAPFKKFQAYKIH